MHEIVGYFDKTVYDKTNLMPIFIFPFALPGFLGPSRTQTTEKQYMHGSPFHTG